MKNLISDFLIALGGFLLSIVSIIVVTMLGSPTIAALLGVIIFSCLLFHQNIYQKDSKIFSRKNGGNLLLVGLFSVVILPTFLIPLPVPPLPDPNIEGLQTETITLSKGEKMYIQSFLSEEGNNKPPVLFVNGGPGGPTSEGTLEFLKQLSEQGYNVYSFDHYSAGRSQLQNPDISLLTINDEVRRVSEIVDYVGKGQKIYIIGHSYAGALLGRFLSIHSAQIESAIFIDTSPLFDLTDRGNTRDKLVLNPALEEQLHAAEAENEEEPQSPSEVFDLLMNGSEGLPYYHRIRMTLIMLWPNDNLPIMGSYAEAGYVMDSIIGTTGISFVANTINTSIEESDDYYQQLIEQTTPPLLVVHPEDGLIPWEIHKDYESFFDQVVYLPWADADHGVWDTRGNELAEKLAEFFQTQTLQNAYTEISDPFGDN